MLLHLLAILSGALPEHRGLKTVNPKPCTPPSHGSLRVKPLMGTGLMQWASVINGYLP